MNQCKRDGCNTGISDKATWCSDACRKAASRTQPGQITPDKSDKMSDLTPDKSDKCQPGQVAQTPEDRQAQEVQFNISAMKATRTNPNQLNYGKPMSTHELEQAGRKANRVPIPGDHDYHGVCKQVDGKWTAPNKDRTEPEQKQDG